MQRWEYRSLKRIRKMYPFSGLGEWEWEEDLSGPVISQLGKQGWELVTVIARSTQIGQTYSGITDEEEWIFKRPLES